MGFCVRCRGPRECPGKNVLDDMGLILKIGKRAKKGRYSTPPLKKQW